MQSCVMLPKEAILICRPALRKACGENRHAAKLLSYLLFRASLCQEVKQEVEPLNAVPRSQGRAVLQERAITIYRTQGQIVREMDGELCTRTLRDEAIPCLIELVYLTCGEIKGERQTTAYTLHPDVIQQGLDHPVKANVLLTHFANLDVTHPGRFRNLQVLPPLGVSRSPAGSSCGNSCH